MACAKALGQGGACSIPGTESPCSWLRGKESGGTEGGEIVMGARPGGGLGHTRACVFLGASTLHRPIPRRHQLTQA